MCVTLRSYGHYEFMGSEREHVPTFTLFNLQTGLRPVPFRPASCSLVGKFFILAFFFVLMKLCGAILRDSGQRRRLYVAELAGPVQRSAHLASIARCTLIQRLDVLQHPSPKQLGWKIVGKQYRLVRTRVAAKVAPLRRVSSGFA